MFSVSCVPFDQMKSFGVVSPLDLQEASPYVAHIENAPPGEFRILFINLNIITLILSCFYVIFVILQVNLYFSCKTNFILYLKGYFVGFVF